MKKHLLIVMLMLISFSAFAQRKALVIGNSRYGSDRIPTSLNDAQLAADALGAINYEVTHLQDLNYDEMLKALDGFKAKLRTGDTAVFYFAGFTKQEAGRNYLIPNAQNVGKTEQLISVDVVLESLSRATNSFMFLENRTLPRGFFSKLWGRDKGLSSIQRLNQNQGFAMASDIGKDLVAQGERYSIFSYSLFNKMTSEMYNYPDLMRAVQEEVSAYTAKAQKPFWQATLQAPFTFYEPIQNMKYPFRLPAYKGLDGGGSYNF